MLLVLVSLPQHLFSSVPLWETSHVGSSERSNELYIPISDSLKPSWKAKMKNLNCINLPLPVQFLDLAWVPISSWTFFYSRRPMWQFSLCRNILFIIARVDSLSTANYLLEWFWWLQINDFWCFHLHQVFRSSQKSWSAHIQGKPRSYSILFCPLEYILVHSRV